MPLAFPLVLAEFQERLKISVSQLVINTPMQIDRTASGVPLPAQLGEPVWRGAFSLPPTNDANNAARIDALLSVLDTPGASFLVYNPRKTHPADDPTGSILGAATPVISALDGADFRMLSLSGLPASYQLRGGDLIGWQYGSSPTRYALHRLVSDVQANGSGVTASFQVTPPIQPGVTTSTPVTLIKPVIKARLEPNPGYGVQRPVVSEGPQFSFVQIVGA
ncbi:MAG: hypothetical protein VR71_02195 [Roseovarius sp. BRH_c41]|uniref:hypothetical protein n=1 Tax=Roseovarius sp. BRH_c41 TaxID=1629709 RepID=UPI0005F1D432|nr:hypothetical protein [Roseovarius sp. BRH_c41]KJS45244.1 MAG: hypothetical protein VR71_02195 [Roseovarius sp. BRH_c41]